MKRNSPLKRTGWMRRSKKPLRRKSSMNSDNRWKNRAYLDAAKGQPCVLCGKNDGTTVAAHLPHAGIGFGAGIGQKCADWLIGDCCNGPGSCHEKLDSGEWRNDFQVRMKAFALTFQRRLEQGFWGD